MPVLTANSSLLTYSSKLYEVLQYYFAPSSTASEFVDVPNSLYAFIGRVTPWPDPFNPPAPEQSQFAIKETFKNIIAVKKIISSDISPVVPRRNWVTGTVYEYYDDRVNMFAVDANNLVSKNFYVKKYACSSIIKLLERSSFKKISCNGIVNFSVKAFSVFVLNNPIESINKKNIESILKKYH